MAKYNCKFSKFQNMKDKFLEVKHEPIIIPRNKLDQLAMKYKKQKQINKLMVVLTIILGVTIIWMI